MFSRILLCACLCAAPSRGDEDPLKAPPELKTFVRTVTMPHQGTRARLQALLTAIFKPQDQGGLGIEYDNSRTRTLNEVWEERKANCLSMTAMFIAACQTIGVEAKYAEPVNTNRWHKVGSVIRYERHVVALIPLPALQDMVADFLPQLRRRVGMYIVDIISEQRLRSFFHSNRAVEFLEGGQMDAAIAESQRALKVDPASPVGWNIHGVVLRYSGNTEAAEKAFLKALELDPKDGTAMGNLETVYRDRGDLVEASRYRQMSQELRRKDPYFNAFLAEEALTEGNVEEARARIETALKLHPREPEFHLFRARIHLLDGNLDAATRAIEEARKWGQPSERERYENKLDALRRWD